VIRIKKITEKDQYVIMTQNISNSIKKIDTTNLKKVQQLFYRYNPLKNTYQRAVYCIRCGKTVITEEIGGILRSKCPDCGYIEYRNPAPAVSILISENEKVLMGKRSSGNFEAGKWCMPCGFVEYDEDFLTAACRETLEESGLVVKLRSIINVTANFLTPDLHSIVIVFLAERISGEPVAGDDLIDLQWVPLNGPYPEFAFKADKEIIQRFAATYIHGLPIDTDFLSQR
jgi:ADP-ribose pyrophosphatase YjhB (NUDIX family)